MKTTPEFRENIRSGKFFIKRKWCSCFFGQCVLLAIQIFNRAEERRRALRRIRYWRPENIEKRRIADRSPRVKERQRLRYHAKIKNNPALMEIARLRVKAWNERNPGKSAQRAAAYLNNPENKEKIKAYRKKWRERPHVKMLFHVRGMLYSRVKRFKTGIKTSSLKILGCSIDFLKSYLEGKFLPGMSWNNHGMNGWHIDHIRPCKSFDMTKIEDVEKCFHYTNLQPLWGSDNIRKGAKWNG